MLTVPRVDSPSPIMLDIWGCFPQTVSPFPVLLLPRAAAQSSGPKSVALIAAVLQLQGAVERVETESSQPLQQPC